MKKDGREEKFQNGVREALQYVNNYDKVRWKIVDIAINVCDISHGGRKSDSLWTLSRFADEIEINRKTLSEWVRCKKLVLEKLPKGIQENPQKHKFDDFKMTLERVNENSTNSEVESFFLEVTNLNPEQRKFKKYLKHINSVLYNVQRPLLMKDIEDELLNEFVQKCQLIANLCKTEFQLRERYSTPEQNAIRLGLKKKGAMKEYVSDEMDKA